VTYGHFGDEILIFKNNLNGIFLTS